MPARPREEYRLRDLIEQLNLALETYIDRAVVEIDPETAGRWIHVSQWTATRPTPPASQGDVAFELEQRK
jgi:hypothetical protein